ncbi:MAG: hypothetical protein IJ339_07055, partial [Oscillospiraceae bacterium]|nr:hypothetical protein [Oscillospiraceae bacterium]
MKVIKKAPYQLCCFFGVMALSITLILSLFNKVVVTNDTSEYVNYYIFKFNYVVCAAVVFCIVKYSKKITDKISVTLLLIICTLIYIVFGIYFIVNVEPVLKADAQIVYNIAQAFIVKDYSAMNIGQYLYTCPHQLGLVVYESILLRIWNSPYAMFAANLLHVLVINFFTVKISALSFESNKTIVKYTIIGVFAFFPQLFFVVFAYGQIPGLSFSTIAVYFTIKYLKYGKGKNLLAATIGSAFAVVVRNNYIILVLALCAVCVLKLLKKVDIRTAVILICLLFAIFMPSKILLGFYEAKSGIDIQGEPKLLYVAMGLQ